jgi:hypothetical protein
MVAIIALWLIAASVYPHAKARAKKRRDCVDRLAMKRAANQSDEWHRWSVD